ncbi:MAG TPA: ATP-binding protein [Actinomycetota bacterium]|nr:ATP-binding protein [Actinomycetota bacterium]
MSTRSSTRASWLTPALLLIAGAGVTLAYIASETASAGTSDLPIVAVSCLLSTVVILFRSRQRDAWQSAPWLGLGMLGLTALSASFTWLGDGPARRGVHETAFVLVGLMFLVALAVEFRNHVAREDRREIVADIALLTVAIGIILFLFLRPERLTGFESAVTASLALMAATGFSGFGALALVLPHRAHIGLFIAVSAMCSALGAFTQQWVAGVFVLGQSRIDLPIALASLLIAALVTTVPRRSPEPRMEPTRYGRAILTSLSVAAASSALALVAVKEIDDGIDPLRASMLIGMLAAAVALRILVNQVRGTHAQRAVQEALEQKEAALADTDKALGRLRRANETLRESEERLRTVFEAAIDGIVELDHQNVILRSNEAFCRMIDLPQSLVEGQPWSALAASIEADDSFAELPATGPTGQGTLHREGHSIYLESRTSQIPGDPPRRLLLVRDVTAARVADQTIRSLFKFLQDRDEDRTRIMRRTNAAIESERNRIARDLHDGPVQGVSAASLSLEAVLLMLKAGEMGEGFEVLAKVRRELSEEADNLRRLMSGLRPPLLEERGLVPALRETLDRYGRDNGVRTEFRAKAAWEIPRDLETLAFRIVQEALSNSAKHADAASVNVAVDTGGGQLRVEIVDDGVGFDSGKAREFLQSGRVGLASMRERVELANGTFMVHSAPGRGTTVLASLPLDAVPAAREFAGSDAT